MCTNSSGLRTPNLGELIVNGLTKQQAEDLRRAAEYLTLQMRLTPHPTERSRIRAMADTADYVAERIDALLTAPPAEQRPTRTPIGELLRKVSFGL
jgi:phosphoenolpyruvate carboxylase